MWCPPCSAFSFSFIHSWELKHPLFWRFKEKPPWTHVAILILWSSWMIRGKQKGQELEILMGPTCLKKSDVNRCKPASIRRVLVSMWDQSTWGDAHTAETRRKPLTVSWRLWITSVLFRSSAGKPEFPPPMRLIIELEKYLRNWEIFLQGYCNNVQKRCIPSSFQIRVLLQRPPGQFQMLPLPTCQIAQGFKMYLHKKSEFLFWKEENLVKALYWWRNRRVEN